MRGKNRRSDSRFPLRTRETSISTLVRHLVATPCRGDTLVPDRLFQRRLVRCRALPFEHSQTRLKRMDLLRLCLNQCGQHLHVDLGFLDGSSRW